MARLDLAGGYSKAYSDPVNGRFCSFRLILPPIVHCHNVTFDSLPRRNIQFQSLHQALYLESLKDSGMLFSSHWLVPPGVTNN